MACFYCECVFGCALVCVWERKSRKSLLWTFVRKMIQIFEVFAYVQWPSLKSQICWSYVINVFLNRATFQIIFKFDISKVANSAISFEDQISSNFLLREQKLNNWCPKTKLISNDDNNPFKLHILMAFKSVKSWS